MRALVDAEEWTAAAQYAATAGPALTAMFNNAAPLNAAAAAVAASASATSTSTDDDAGGSPDLGLGGPLTPKLPAVLVSDLAGLEVCRRAIFASGREGPVAVDVEWRDPRPVSTVGGCPS